jgi:hypothetical protein
MEKSDLTNLKKDVAQLCTVISTVDVATCETSPGGKKITLPEWTKIAVQAIPLIRIPFKYARREFKLTPEEKLELMNHIEREFQLRNKAAEALTEAALSVVFSIAQFIKARKMADENPE